MAQPRVKLTAVFPDYFYNNNDRLVTGNHRLAVKLPKLMEISVNRVSLLLVSVVYNY